jgi:hypothetical protein
MAPTPIRRATRGACHARRALHDRIIVRPRAETRALPDDGRPPTTAESLTAPFTPRLDGTSRSGQGSAVPGGRSYFGTTDFLVLLDVEEFDPRPIVAVRVIQC